MKNYNNKKSKKHIYGLANALLFGKYKGQTLRQVIDKHSDYIVWCVENVGSFQMNDEAWNYAASINATLAAFCPQPKSNKAEVTVEWTNASGIECLIHYPWKDVADARRRYIENMKKTAVDAVLLPVCTSKQLELFA